MSDLAIDVGGIRLQNPVMPASGCFGPELSDLIATHELGAVVTKTIFASSRSGNAADRLTETPYGMLNSVGIPSPGAATFISTILPRYRASGTATVVSIGGLTTREYFDIADALHDEPVDAFEINVSCPNLEDGGLAIGSAPANVLETVSGVRRRLPHAPLWVKLTPSVTDIAEIVRAAADGGADAVTVCNSFPGLAIDIRTGRAALGAGSGGYTGPAIKPLALKLVRQAAECRLLPVIGCGGITTAEDVIEFVMAGATAVQIGTATFTRPSAMTDIVAALPSLLDEIGATSIRELVGSMSEPHQGVDASV